MYGCVARGQLPATPFYDQLSSPVRKRSLAGPVARCALSKTVVSVWRVAEPARRILASTATGLPWATAGARWYGIRAAEFVGALQRTIRRRPGREAKGGGAKADLRRNMPCAPALRVAARKRRCQRRRRCRAASCVSPRRVGISPHVQRTPVSGRVSSTELPDHQRFPQQTDVSPPRQRARQALRLDAGPMRVAHSRQRQLVEPRHDDLAQSDVISVVHCQDGRTSLQCVASCEAERPEPRHACRALDLHIHPRALLLSPLPPQSEHEPLWRVRITFG